MTCKKYAAQLWLDIYTTLASVTSFPQRSGACPNVAARDPKNKLNALFILPYLFLVAYFPTSLLLLPNFSISLLPHIRPSSCISMAPPPMTPVYIVSAVRTPIGQFQGYVQDKPMLSNPICSDARFRSLASQTAIQLGSHAIKCISSRFLCTQ